MDVSEDCKVIAQTNSEIEELITIIRTRLDDNNDAIESLRFKIYGETPVEGVTNPPLRSMSISNYLHEFAEVLEKQGSDLLMFNEVLNRVLGNKIHLV